MSTLNTVIRYLQTTDGPKTITEIAAYLGVHSQTVREYITQGVNQGLIIKVGKRGKAFTYAASNATSRGLTTIIWKGAATPLSELLYNWATNPESRPDAARTISYPKGAFQLIQYLYTIALNATDPDNPKLITMTELRDTRMTLIQLLESAKSDMMLLESILNNDALFTPKELPLALILKEEQFGPEQLKAMVEEINKPLPKR